MRLKQQVESSHLLFTVTAQLSHDAPSLCHDLQLRNELMSEDHRLWAVAVPANRFCVPFKNATHGVQLQVCTVFGTEQFGKQFQLAEEKVPCARFSFAELTSQSTSIKVSDCQLDDTVSGYCYTKGHTIRNRLDLQACHPDEGCKNCRYCRPISGIATRAVIMASICGQQSEDRVGG